MKISIENLGIIRKASIEPGDITIICGKNNTGKTYVTYTYYGFLDFIRNALAHHVSEIIDLGKIDLSPLKTKGILTIDLQCYVEQYKDILDKICEIYTQNIPEVFVSRKDRFQNTKFSVHLDRSELNGIAQLKISLPENLVIESRPDENCLQITKIQNADSLTIPEYIIKDIIGHIIIRSIFQPVFGSYVFIASVERTGASIFKKELYLNRNRIVERLGESSKNGDVDIRDVLFNSYSPYPLPVKDNVAFIQELPPLTRKSWLAENHPEILLKFSEIVGGTYTLDKEGELLFIPASTQKRSQTKLQLTESSSVVRALIHLDYYLRYKASKGDILIIDEPELNLHPENQRKIAKIFARLVNVGIHVFVTTHSDYIVKELGLLVMLSNDTEASKRILSDNSYGYDGNEAIEEDRIHVYIADKGTIMENGRKLPKEYHTLIPASVSKERGIELSSFDEVINLMNEIQDKLFWG